LNTTGNVKQSPLQPKQPSGQAPVRSSQEVLKLLFNKPSDKELAPPAENASTVGCKASSDSNENARYTIILVPI